ncbi:endolytic transglycosylase MltG [Amycolatopsis vastitatis]|uniref:Endolytic murein transglycosylase n=1 Tax=Amycolatopsis vastitatis TaxID=1905142 RepID=A0A229STN3_9PSEU|nr:endolytic transglycosylase MltG [Amycolatopsis vastitatis]OXM62465.1 aminodeoxychorismate lyase [Amycolatopsis vastitatis]
MNEQPPERGRRRLREPDEATPPPSRPAPRRVDPRDPRASGYQELPPSRHSGQHELPQPSRRARPEPGYDPAGGRRRRLEPTGTLPPADDEFDPQAQQAAPARAARARHGLDEGSEIEPPAARRRRAAPEPGEAASRPPRRRAAAEPVEPPPSRRRRAEPEPQPGRRGPVPEPMEAAEPPRGRRRAAPDPAEAAEPRSRRAALEPDVDPRRGAPEPPPPARRSVQPGDRSAVMPEPGAEPPRRRRPPPPPVREEPATDVIPALAPPPPAEPPRPPREEPELFAEDDEYADDAAYDEYDDEYADYDEAEYDDDYEDEPEKPRKKKGKRALGWVAALVVIVLLAGGAYYGFNKIFGYADFEGAGDGDVLFQVDDGDSTSAIGAKLATAGVVASGKAFVKAGEDNPKLAKIQHGFYVMKSHMSGASAVERIVAPEARVGQLEIRPYTQFDDITQPDGKVTPGVYSLMAKASCAQLNGKSTCVSTDDLRKVVDGADLKVLGVPDWAIEPANKTDRKDRRLEGLIAPGVYDVRPGASPQEIITQLVKTSAEALQNSGLSPQSTGPGMTPYQTLIIASIIEREAVKVDFGKLSRVIYNRLAINMRLQMDSTVNYVLDRPTLATNDDDRAKSGVYNTYRVTGLPPTPISVPSPDAIQAAVHPPAGEWLYVVKCEKNGLSCFAVNLGDHNKNVAEARAKGVF